MKIKKIYLKNFRNFENTIINFTDKNLFVIQLLYISIMNQFSCRYAIKVNPPNELVERTLHN